MKTYYIYHIKGVKIGCSVNPKKRVNKQGYYEWELLEEHTDINIASKRELELQKEYGYKVDTVSYKQTLKNKLKVNCSVVGKKGGLIGGKKTYSLKKGVHNPEKRKEWSRLTGLKRRKLTPEQLEFIKNNYAPSTNQHNRLPNKMGSFAIAKVLNVTRNSVKRAIKNYI